MANATMARRATPLALFQARHAEESAVTAAAILSRSLTCVGRVRFSKEGGSCFVDPPGRRVYKTRPGLRE
jgi:hypothetical protein